MNTEKPHLWHRMEPTILLVGVFISLGVWCVTWYSERQKLHLEYVRLAVGLLHPTQADKRPQVELRAWAVDVLQDSARVKLPEKAKQLLIEGEANFGSDFSNNYGYSVPLESAKPKPKAKSQ